MNLGSFVSTKPLLIFAISINNKHFIMKKSLKKLSFAILFLVTMVNLQAQSKMEYNGYAGISTAGIFDYGHCLTASINPIWAKNDNFKLESRIGYTLDNATESLFSEVYGKAQWAMIQVGPRLVLRSVDKKFRPAMNILWGYYHLLSSRGYARRSEQSGFSVALSIEAELDRFIFGISLEGVGNEIPNNAGLKLGYKF